MMSDIDSESNSDASTVYHDCYSDVCTDDGVECVDIHSAHNSWGDKAAASGEFMATNWTVELIL